MAANKPENNGQNQAELVSKSLNGEDACGVEPLENDIAKAESACVELQINELIDAKGAVSRLRKIASLIIKTVTIALAVSILMVIAYRFINPPGTLTMLSRKLSGDVIIHPWASYRDISPNLVLAVIASEDTKFCRHRGFDLGELKAAMKDARDGKGLRGASTISQQTAKNAFLWQGGGIVRKGVEAWYTGWMELVWTKRRTMEVYLNIAEWGDGLFGAEAAAQKRFGKSAVDLTRQEAALLAAVLPNPNKWRVDPPGPYVQKRTVTIRKRMRVVENNGGNRCVW